MKQYKFKIGGVDYEVEVNNPQGNMMCVSVNGTPYEVELAEDAQAKKTPILTPRTQAPAQNRNTSSQPAISQAPKVEGNGHKIESPLPGTIMQVKVNVGDSVKKGQCLLVMEAMKMENNVMSDKDGSVKAIRVKVGDNVLQGDVLLEIA